MLRQALVEKRRQKVTEKENEGPVGTCPQHTMSGARTNAPRAPSPGHSVSQSVRNMLEGKAGRENFKDKNRNNPSKIPPERNLPPS